MALLRKGNVRRAGIFFRAIAVVDSANRTLTKEPLKPPLVPLTPATSVHGLDFILVRLSRFAPPTWLLGPLALIAMLLPWAYASPVGSSPDENYHLTYVWCIAGDSPECVQNTSDDDEQVISVIVPATVGQPPCFIGDSLQEATCRLDGLPEGTYESARFSENSSYPPIFYHAMHPLVGDDVERSVIQMRMLNVLISGIMLTLAIWVATPRVRTAIGISWTIGLVPFGLFFIPSVNPNGWAIIGSASFWVFLITLMNNRHPTISMRIAAMAGLLVSATLATVRADQVWVLLLSFIAALFVSKRWQSHKWLIAASLSLVALFAAFLAWRFNVGRYVRSFDFAWPMGNSQTDQPNPLAKVLIEFPYFLTGHLGAQQPWSQRDSIINSGTEGWTNTAFLYGLGSVDVTMPSIVGLVGTLLLGAITFLALARTNRMRIAAPLILLLGILVQVLAMRALGGWGGDATVGFAWFVYPRYTVPALMVLLAMLVMARTTRGPAFNRKQRALAATALTVSATVSLMAVMSRYMYGQDHSWLQFETYRGWWWNFGPDPIAVIVLSALGAAVYFAVMLSLGKSKRPLRSNQSPSQRDRYGAAENNSDEGAPVQTSGHRTAT